MLILNKTKDETISKLKLNIQYTDYLFELFKIKS